MVEIAAAHAAVFLLDRFAPGSCRQLRKAGQQVETVLLPVIRCNRRANLLWFVFKNLAVMGRFSFPGHGIWFG